MNVPLLVWILGVWVGLAVLVAWGWMRWHQWLRGDFDKPHG